MKVLVTGASGFIGKNLAAALENNKKAVVLPFNSESDPALLDIYCEECRFVYHLAAVHRPNDQGDFDRVNHLFFAGLLEKLRFKNNHCPVLLPSSIHVGQDNVYGSSKLAAEAALIKHSRLSGARAIIYRLTNTFGRHARPNGHSVVATFCYNIARGLPVMISDPAKVMKFYYIDDVVNAFTAHLEQDIAPGEDGFYRLPGKLEHVITLQELADRLYYFKEKQERGEKLANQDAFTARLYETFLSYLPG